MKKITAVLYRYYKWITIANLIAVICFGFYLYVSVLSIGHNHPYHNTVTVMEERSCDYEHDLCNVIGKVNDDYEESLMIFDGYNPDSTYYQECYLLVYTWKCGNKLYGKISSPYEKHYDLVRGN